MRQKKYPEIPKKALKYNKKILQERHNLHKPIKKE
jgi:hypothetical protein